MPGTVVHIQRFSAVRRCFVGTRVPFRNLIDYLARNHSLDEFLDSFPTVSREQAVAALESAHEAVSARARSAR
jgi:uncharacterized protein (DUF433 family)